MRSVLLIDLRYGGRVPKDLRDALDLMGWNPLRPGIAYVLDWDEAMDAAYPGGVWDRIDLVARTARDIGIQHRLLTMRRFEKIPIAA